VRFGSLDLCSPVLVFYVDELRSSQVKVSHTPAGAQMFFATTRSAKKLLDFLFEKTSILPPGRLK
jgi:hypothetical protein